MIKSILGNMRFSTRVAILVGSATVGMVAFSGYLLVEKQKIVAGMESLGELANLAPIASALVHELQKERGASAGFIGSKGVKFATKLPEQRKLTDEKLALSWKPWMPSTPAHSAPA